MTLNDLAADRWNPLDTSMTLSGLNAWSWLLELPDRDVAAHGARGRHAGDSTAPRRAAVGRSTLRANLVQVAAVFGALLAAPAYAQRPADPAAVTACFTPGPQAHCAAWIAQQIDAAQHTIRVQAYGFTSTPILVALARAQRRGVDVAVLLDKSGEGGKQQALRYLTNAGIPVWIDDKPAIAHNKIIILDGAVVITGSFNFTVSADTRNAENAVAISSPVVAMRFAAYWEARQAASRVAAQ